MIKFNRKHILGLIAGTALVVSTATFGQSSGGNPSNYGFLVGQKPMAVMHMMDKDNKGYVTKAEYMKFHEELFNRMDKNGDGNISAEEWLGRQLRQSDGAN